MINSREMSITPKPPQKKAGGRLLWPALLSGLLITLLLIGQWLWLTRLPGVAEAQIVLPAERAPLFTALFRQRAIVWSVTSSAATMALAVIVAVSPLTWWMQLLARFGQTPGAQLARAVLKSQAPQSAEEWVAEQAALLQATPAQTTQVGETTGFPAAMNPAAAGTQFAQNSPEQANQQPGLQQPSVPQPGTPQPGASQPQPQPGVPQVQSPQPGASQPQAPTAVQPPQAAPPAPQPPTPAPQAQQNLQQLLAQEENIDLKELTDIGDILNSFKDNEDVSPYLLALSQSLGEVEIVTLVDRCRRIAERLAVSNHLRTIA